MTRPSSIGTLAYMLLGPIVWAVHSTVIYSAQSMLCAAAGAWDPSEMVRIVVAATTVLAFAIVATATLKADRTGDMIGAASPSPALRHFQRRVMRLLAIMSLFGIGASAAAATLPVCVALR